MHVYIDKCAHAFCYIQQNHCTLILTMREISQYNIVYSDTYCMLSLPPGHIHLGINLSPTVLKSNLITIIIIFMIMIHFQTAVYIYVLSQKHNQVGGPFIILIVYLYSVVHLIRIRLPRIFF